ncbi:membrane-associating domain-containing protein [Annulohypoxylon maeteangense]|uniref:membrane-associating domain-containing protein n=1 Tax=Annulohypoxylon maeteangense TaxID=1927788 RepID=UPI0020080242|nr:membrane-associating domain-containing protein [Annulohypoxylon maeteangense]KAI0881382.1 membrane-associating domain-containing protein [Annulohypoxylon maeteangense]
MEFGFIPIAHIVAAVFAIIELGLTAYLVSVYDGWYNYYYDYSPPRINFMVFNSVWSLLVLIYVGVVPLYLTSFFHRLAALALNAITTIFWFAGSIALAVFVSRFHDCRSESWCGSAEAAVAFGFFLWALFSFLTVIDALDSLRSRGHNVGPATKPTAYPGP